MTSFPLALMSPLILGMTVVILALPALFLFLGWRAGRSVSGVLVGVALFLGVLDAVVWLAWRPGRFEVASSALRLVWTVRSRGIP
ncbi:hypothetical protein ACLESO_21445 [Pyxidicoccus sp. 3LG]